MRKKLLTFLISLFLVGCKNSSEPMRINVTSIPTSTVPTYATSSPNTSMTLDAVVTTEKIPTAPESPFTIHCVDKTPSTKSDLSGSLLTNSPNFTSKPFLINLKTGEKRTFLNKNDDGANQFLLSPDGQWLANIRWDNQGNENLIVQSVNGEKLFTYPWNDKDRKGIVFIRYWLNNEELVLWRDNKDSINNVILFNPFIKSQTEMSTDYPDIISDDWSWRSSWPSVTIYSPSLDYLVYLSNSEGKYAPPGYQKLVLWDLKNSKQIAEVKDFGFTMVWPIWKSDGSGVIFVKTNEGYPPPENKDEWFFLGVDGRINQLTSLSSYFQNVRIFSYSLSPDEKYLAFAIRADNLEGELRENRLLFLNTTTMEISDNCLRQDRFSDLVWSPNSRQIAYSEPVGEENSRTILVDIIDQKAFVIAEDSQPVLWLKSFE